MPRALVTVGRVRAPAKLAAGARRRLHRRGRVELYIAFDDPCSAVALLDLDARLRGREVTLALRPVLRRGMREDPALESKRAYAIQDARRLACDLGLVLAREQAPAAADCAFLAEWVAAAGAGPAARDFAVNAMRKLWFEERDGAPSREEYLQLWHEHVGGEPPSAGAAALARNERAMRLHWMYETPAAWVHGRWYFAHDRPQQICEWLDELGWRATRAGREAGGPR